ncbi:hypothetical protein ACOSOMT5_P3092 [Acidiphilium sp. MT5]
MARWGMPSPSFALQGRNADPGINNVRNTASPHWRRELVPLSRPVHAPVSQPATFQSGSNTLR